MGKPMSDQLRGLEWDKLVDSGKMVSRDMEVFYPQHRFLNFYVVPLSLDQPRPSVRRCRRWWAMRVILRDTTETRRSTEGDDPERKTQRADAARGGCGA